MIRRWLAALLSMSLWSGSTLAAGGDAKATAGCLTPGLEPFDAAMTQLLRKWDVPGGSLAVSHEGRILLVRGYGLADKSRRTPVTPRTRFRLGSLSKPITAVAILKLVEEGRLSLDDKVLPLLGDLAPPGGAISDPRVDTITVRQLLQHTAGFDRTLSGDPLFMPRAGAALKRQKAKAPPSCQTILRDVLSGPLDFDPGARHAYSNLGYCILGRIIERVGDTSYMGVAQSRVLEPAGASGLALGHTMTPAPDEATYYDYAGAPKWQSMPGIAKGMVPAPYGAFAVEEMDAYGGWIGAPIDYLRFMLAIDGQRGPRLLKEASVRAMLSPPDIPGAPPGEPRFYGLGMNARDLGGGAKNWWHMGHQPGIVTFALRTARGHSWVAAFNSLPRDVHRFNVDLDVSLWAAATRVRVWPLSSASCAAYDR
jgi:CubicO group peptidase (beta-lactamase class C family)